jgi:hypothetical protein
MKAEPLSTRWRLTLWGAGLGLFIALAALQGHQVRQTRFLEPVGVTSATNAFAVWMAEPELPATAAKRQTFQEPFLMLGPMNPGIPVTGTAILYDLPYHPDGYALNLGVASAENQHPPLLTVSVNGSLLHTLQIPQARLGETNPFHSEELVIPGRLLHPGTTNRLAIRNVHGLHWFGHVALIPHPQWHRLLPLLVPLSGWCVLASALMFITSRWGQRRFPLLLGLILFVIYYQSFAIRDLAPLTGFFYSDSADFIAPICQKIFNWDMNKHPLFLPVVRLIIRPLYFLSRDQIVSFSAAFAIIGALNGMTAFLWFRRWLGEFRAAGALALLYAFSLAIWVYSSHYETYIFSSLMGNLFFVLLLGVRQPDRFRGLILPAVAVGLAALAHPPLLILLAVLAIHVWNRRTRTFPWAGLAASALVVAAVFIGGQTMIRHYYAPSTDLPPAIGSHLESARGPVSKEISNIRWVYNNYAGEQRWAPAQLGVVLTGQFVYSLAGLPYPFDWARGVAGLGAYFRSLTGPPALLAILGLWFGALIGLAMNRGLLVRSLILLGFVIVPWLTFFLLFNPSEMLLYSAPMLAPVLAWLAWANRLVWGRHTAGWLLAISLGLALHNAWILSSYY